MAESADSFLGYDEGTFEGMIDYEGTFVLSYESTYEGTFVRTCTLGSYVRTNERYVRTTTVCTYVFYYNMYDRYSTISSNRNNSKQLNTKVRKYNSIIIKVS